MSGLAHIIEAEGVATTLISLVREHTAKIRPPRALWVPFPFGRPFGRPGDAAFQTRVLTAALRLLERAQRPVLEDFGEEAAAPTDHEGWVCPVSLADEPAGDDLATALMAEIGQLRPWHDRAVARRGRSSVGALGRPIEEVARFLASQLESSPMAPPAGMSRGDAVIFATEDLKAYYYEAATAQPGSAPAADLETWLSADTVAGRLLAALRATS